MTDYDPYARTFARSRRTMRWPDLDALLDEARDRLGAERWRTARVLDIGCGGGRLLGPLRERGHAGEYLGTDASEGMVREARAAFPEERFAVTDMRDLGTALAGESFDLACFVASLHHLATPEDRERTLAGVRAITREGGIAILTNWNLSDSRVAEGARARPAENGDFLVPIGGHERYYHAFSADELSTLFERTGWTVLTNGVPDRSRNIVSVI